jgi:hypothetical protein
MELPADTKGFTYFTHHYQLNEAAVKDEKYEFEKGRWVPVVQATPTNRPNAALANTMFKASLDAKRKWVPIAAYRNRPNMMWIDVTGTNVELPFTEVQAICLNPCGQWVMEGDLRTISGTTGWYRPYTYIEAAAMEVYKKKLYAEQNKRIGKPACHKPGPVCMSLPKKGVVTASCETAATSNRKCYAGY